MPHTVLKKDQLIPLIEEGLSHREIAARLKVVKSDVRYWLDKFSLKTRWNLLRSKRKPWCLRCGEKDPLQFYLKRLSMCRSCHSKDTTDRFRSYKDHAIEYKGGCCQTCGVSDRVTLMFHHVDPVEKPLNWRTLRTREFSQIRFEFDKTILVCHNCHHMIHYGPDDNRVRIIYEHIVGKTKAILSYYNSDRTEKIAQQRILRDQD